MYAWLADVNAAFDIAAAVWYLVRPAWRVTVPVVHVWSAASTDSEIALSPPRITISAADPALDCGPAVNRTVEIRSTSKPTTPDRCIIDNGMRCLTLHIVHTFVRLSLRTHKPDAESQQHPTSQNQWLVTGDWLPLPQPSPYGSPHHASRMGSRGRGMRVDILGSTLSRQHDPARPGGA